MIILFDSSLGLIELLFIFGLVLGLGSIFDVLLNFHNGLNDVIGRNRGLLLLFLLISASQESGHHVVALRGHGITCILFLLLLFFICFLRFTLEIFHFLLCYVGGRDFLLSWLWLLIHLDDALLFLEGLLFHFRHFLLQLWYIIFLFFGDDLELLSWLCLLLFLFLKLLLT
jgi:hypothetical protein